MAVHAAFVCVSKKINVNASAALFNFRPMACAPAPLAVMSLIETVRSSNVFFRLRRRAVTVCAASVVSVQLI